MRISILIFIYTIHFAYLKMYTKFEKIGAEKSVTEIFIEKRKKREKIKGLIRNMWLFLLHNTTHHYQVLYQISEF